MLHINFTPLPVLETERLSLRQLEPGDDNELFFFRSDELMNKYIGNPRLKTVGEAGELRQKLNKGIADNEWLFWGITLKNTPKLIGSICLWNISQEDAKAETGYGLHPEVWGNGYMKEALLKVIDFGFEIMQLNTIEAYTHFENHPSTTLLQKLNFKRDTSADMAPGNDNLVVFSLVKGAVNI